MIFSLFGYYSFTDLVAVFKVGGFKGCGMQPLPIPNSDFSGLAGRRAGSAGSASSEQCGFGSLSANVDSGFDLQPLQWVFFKRCVNCEKRTYVNASINV